MDTRVVRFGRATIQTTKELLYRSKRTIRTNSLKKCWVGPVLLPATFLTDSKEGRSSVTSSKSMKAQDATVYNMI